MMEGLFYALAAVTGMIVKVVDEAEDNTTIKKCSCSIYKIPLGIIYGVLIGCTIMFASFSTLWLAALLAQFMTGKIDKPAHFTGFFIALLFAMFGGVADFRSDYFVAFAIFAALDELELINWWGKDYRFGLKAAALIVGLLDRYDYFIAIVLFDGAYMLAAKMLPKICSHNEDQ